MKTFPAHISVMVTEAETSLESGDTMPAEAGDELHPLVSELRAAIENPAGADIGTYARLVDQLMGELSLMNGRLAPFGHPARPGKPGHMPERPRIPMSEEEETKIVEYFIAHGIKAHHH